MGRTDPVQSAWGVTGLAALTGVGLYLVAFYPGYMSHDSAFQYWQLRHQDYFSMSPVTMTLIWQGLDHWLPGPGGMFILQVLMFWSGLWVLFCQLKGLSPIWLAVIMLVFGLWPFNLLIVPHIWKDVLMLNCLIWATALFLRAVQSTEHRSQWRLAASACAAASTLFRPDAVIPAGVMIVMFWIPWGRWPRRQTGQINLLSLFKPLLIGLSAIVLAAGARISIESLTDARQQSLFPSVALWDLARVSVREQQNLVPAFTAMNEKMNEQTLSAYVPAWSNVPVLTHQLHSGLWEPYSSEQQAAIRKAWLNLWVSFPGAYLEHRLEVFAELLRWQDDPTKPETVYRVRALTPYRDNPFHAMNQSALHQALSKGLDAVIESPLFKPWSYLLISLILCLGLFRQRAGAVPALIVCLSGVGHALSLMILAPSAEIRYLLWSVNSWMLAILILLTLERGKSSLLATPSSRSQQRNAESGH